jgi:hypothetical protein
VNIRDVYFLPVFIQNPLRITHFSYNGFTEKVKNYHQSQGVIYKLIVSNDLWGAGTRFHRQFIIEIFRSINYRISSSERRPKTISQQYSGCLQDMLHSLEIGSLFPSTLLSGVWLTDGLYVCLIQNTDSALIYTRAPFRLGFVVDSTLRNSGKKPFSEIGRINTQAVFGLEDLLYRTGMENKIGACGARRMVACGEHPAQIKKGRCLMLYTLAVVLIVLWLLGLVTSYTMGGLIHALLVIALVVIVLGFISGRRIT